MPRTDRQAGLEALWERAAAKAIEAGFSAEDVAKSQFVAGFKRWRDLVGDEVMAMNVATILAAMPGVGVQDDREEPDNPETTAH